MSVTVADLWEKFRSPGGRKLFRYSVASVVALAVSEICLGIFAGVLRMSAIPASTLATAIAAVPNYYLNRQWAWGKSGRSHLMKEVVPFWALAFLGWAVSTYAVWAMERIALHHHYTHLEKTLAEEIVYVAAFGVLWVGKFIIFNKVMFVHHQHDHGRRERGAEAPVA